MKRLQLKLLLITFLVLIGGIVSSVSVVKATDTSGTVSTATAQFYGKKDSNNVKDNTRDSGVRNETLPQTGQFVVPEASLVGYVLLTSGVLLTVFSFRRQRKYESSKGA